MSWATFTVVGRALSQTVAPHERSAATRCDRSIEPQGRASVSSISDGAGGDCVWERTGVSRIGRADDR